MGFLDTKFMVLLKISFIKRTNSECNNVKYIVYYDTKHNAIYYFAILKVVKYSFIHFNCKQIIFTLNQYIQWYCNVIFINQLLFSE